MSELDDLDRGAAGTALSQIAGLAEFPGLAEDDLGRLRDAARAELAAGATWEGVKRVLKTLPEPAWRRFTGDRRFTRLAGLTDQEADEIWRRVR